MIKRVFHFILDAAGKLGRDAFLNFNTGTAAFLFHRISGLALVFYLCLHTLALSTARYGKGPFDATLSFLQSPFFNVLEGALIAAVFYHLLNGLRLLLLDLTLLTRSHKALWWGLMAVFSGVMMATAYLVLGKLLLHA